MTELIVALDGDAADMGAIFLRLRRETPIRWFKIGPQVLLQHAGMILIENMMREDGTLLMADLKVYDTEDTVVNIVRRAVDMGAHMITVHGTPSVMEAVTDAKPKNATYKVLAVGPTTDQPQTDFSHWLEDAPIELCDGIVLGVRSLMRWQKYLAAHKLLAVCPGIRRQHILPLPEYIEWKDSPNDHRNPATPYEALQAKANFIVVGRPITTATDPVVVAKAILDEMVL
jgi:orotidine-5'-phosphate decarboxylase